MPYRRSEQCVDCCWFPCERNYDHTIEKCDWFKQHKAIRGTKTYDFDFGPDAPTAVDLFCGCGGASLGFIKASSVDFKVKKYRSATGKIAKK